MREIPCLVVLDFQGAARKKVSLRTTIAENFEFFMILKPGVGGGWAPPPAYGGRAKS